MDESILDEIDDMSTGSNADTSENTGLKNSVADAALTGDTGNDTLAGSDHLSKESAGIGQARLPPSPTALCKTICRQ